MGHAGPKYCVQRMKGLEQNESGRGIDSVRSEREVVGSGAQPRSV